MKYNESTYSKQEAMGLGKGGGSYINFRPLHVVDELLVRKSKPLSSLRRFNGSRIRAKYVKIESVNSLLKV